MTFATEAVRVNRSRVFDSGPTVGECDVCWCASDVRVQCGGCNAGDRVRPNKCNSLSARSARAYMARPMPSQRSHTHSHALSPAHSLSPRNAAARTLSHSFFFFSSLSLPNPRRRRRRRRAYIIVRTLSLSLPEKKKKTGWSSSAAAAALRTHHSRTFPRSAPPPHVIYFGNGSSW